MTEHRGSVMSRARTVCCWTYRLLATVSAIIWGYEGIQQAATAMGYATAPAVAAHTAALAFFVTSGWMLNIGWSK